MQDTHCGGDLTPLQRCSRCILEPSSADWAEETNPGVLKREPFGRPQLQSPTLLNISVAQNWTKDVKDCSDRPLLFLPLWDLRKPSMKSFQLTTSWSVDSVVRHSIRISFLTPRYTQWINCIKTLRVSAESKYENKTKNSFEMNHGKISLWGVNFLHRSFKIPFGEIESNYNLTSSTEHRSGQAWLKNRQLPMQQISPLAIIMRM